MGLLLAFFLLSIVFSFLCSVWEAVLLSITPSYISIKEKENAHIAKDLKAFKEDIDKPLAAILTLNTIAHTVGAIGVGAQAGALFGERYIEIGGKEIMSWEAVIAVLMTLAILILSEIIPKTIGANNWQRLTPFTVKSLKFLLFILTPLIWLSQMITKGLKKDKGKPVLTRNDLLVMTEVGKESGAIQESEQKVIYNLLRFNKIIVKDIMTPRSVVKSASEKTLIKDFHAANEQLVFSRIPVFEGNPDNVTGMFLKDELLLALVENKGDQPLSTIKRSIIVSNEETPIPQLLNEFIEKKEHMALVVGKYGGMQGIVTMEDIIETLLGLEIVDELDNVEDMQALARRKWEARAKKMGLLSHDSLKDSADIKE
ncbi:MAG: hemolysin family protein [Bacteroidota bacterium]